MSHTQCDGSKASMNNVSAISQEIPTCAEYLVCRATSHIKVTPLHSINSLTRFS